MASEKDARVPSYSPVIILTLLEEEGKRERTITPKTSASRGKGGGGPLCTSLSLKRRRLLELRVGQLNLLGPCIQQTKSEESKEEETEETMSSDASICLFM